MRYTEQSFRPRSIIANTKKKERHFTTPIIVDKPVEVVKQPEIIEDVEPIKKMNPFRDGYVRSLFDSYDKYTNYQQSEIIKQLEK